MKRIKRRIVALASLAAGFCLTLQAEEKKAVGPDAIAKLIDQLGDEKMQVREDAMSQLRKIHSAADALRKASESHESFEVRLRAEDLLKLFVKEKYVLDLSAPSAHEGVDVVGGLVISRDGSTALTRCRRQLTLWDLKDLKVIKTMDDAPHEPWGLWLANGPAYFLDLSPDGSTLATTDPVGSIYFHDLQNDFKITKWTPPAEVLAERPDSKALLWHGRFFPKSQKFATSSDSSLIDIWDLETGKLIETLPKVSNDRGLTFEISPDEKFLIAAFNQDHPEGQVLLWNFATQKWSAPEATEMVTSFRFFADGVRVLGTGAKGSLYLFEVGDDGLKKLKTYQNLGDYVANVVLNPGEKTALLGMRTPLGEIAELDLETGEILWRSQPHGLEGATVERLAFLPDGRLLAMFATGEMTIWKKM